MSFFDQLFFFQEPPPSTFTAEEGLMTTGLIVGMGQGSGSTVRYDELPADNTLDRNIFSSTFQGDLYAPTTAKQVTPWTRPNINGYTIYPGGFTPSWDAIDNIRYTGGANGQMAFDYIEDFRTQPVIRADSWIGAETNDYTFQTDLVVEAGATLTIAAGTTLNFAAGKGIDVYGSLNIEGTTGNEVTLTSNPEHGRGERQEWFVRRFHEHVVYGHGEWPLQRGGSGLQCDPVQYQA